MRRTENLKQFINQMVIGMSHFFDDQIFDGSPVQFEEVVRYCEHNFEIDLTQSVLRGFPGDYHTLDIEIFFYSRRRTQQLPIDEIGIIVAQMLLGQDLFQKWVGTLHSDYRTLAAKQDGLPHVELNSLPKIMNGFKRNIQQKLCERPLYIVEERLEASALVSPEYHHPEPGQKPQIGTVFEIESPEAENYPAQSDLVVASARFDYLWLAMHSDVPFYSCRFSKCEEIFCYLKIDGRDGFAETLVSDRTDIEEALNEVLVANGLGCAISGGTGRVYSYIDLAITDLPRAIKSIREVVQSLRLTKRTWLQYFDADKTSEWEVMYIDSPPPPAS